MQRDMFKWKPATHHTIDFMWKNGALLLNDRGAHVEASIYLNIHPAGDASWPSRSHLPVIMECRCTRSRGRGRASGEKHTTWTAHPLHVRMDKSEPNSVRVAAFTLQNIEENITVDELVPPDS
jgi:hypothetical protein